MFLIPLKLEFRLIKTTRITIMKIAHSVWTVKRMQNNLDRLCKSLLFKVTFSHFYIISLWFCISLQKEQHICMPQARSLSKTGELCIAGHPHLSTSCSWYSIWGAMYFTKRDHQTYKKYVSALNVDDFI